MGILVSVSGVAQLGDLLRSFHSSVLPHHVRMVSSISSLESGRLAIFFKDRRWHSDSRSLLAESKIAVILWVVEREKKRRLDKKHLFLCLLVNYGRVCSLTCMVSSLWRSLSRLTMVCSLWALTLVFLSLVLSKRLFSKGFIRLISREGVLGSLNTHHSTRSATSLMSLDWFWRHCAVTQKTAKTSQNLHLQSPLESVIHTNILCNMASWYVSVFFFFF